MPSHQLAYNFDPLPDGVIVCDREGQILQANAAALQLFEVPSEALCRRRDYQEFLDGSVGFIIGDEYPFTYAFSFDQFVLKLPQLVYRVYDLSRARASASEFSALIKLYRNWEVVHPIILPKRNHLSSNHISPPLFLRRYLPRNEMVMLTCAVHTGLPDQAYREYKSKTPQRYHRARGKNQGCITASPCEFFSCGAFS